MSADDALKKVWLARSQLGQGNFSEAIRLKETVVLRDLLRPIHRGILQFVGFSLNGRQKQAICPSIPKRLNGKAGERGYLGNVGITDPANQPHYGVAPDGRFLINTLPGRCSRFSNYHPAELAAPRNKTHNRAAELRDVPSVDGLSVYRTSRCLTSLILFIVQNLRSRV